MNLHNRTFRTAENKHGVSSGETIFHYSQEGDIVTGTYAGGKIKRGQILGRQVSPNTIHLLYHCLTTDGLLMAGESEGVLSINENGAMEIAFDWQWLNGDRSGGKSHYVEVG